MPVEFVIVDAFAELPFEGNPASVLVLQRETYPPYELLQKIAQEFNLAETAFILAPKQAFEKTSSTIRLPLRFMAPEIEVDLCGHATLASAHVMFSKVLPQHFGSQNGPSAIEFETRSGILTATRSEGGAEAPLISLNFPEVPATPSDDEILLEGTEKALGIPRSRFLYFGVAKYQKDFDILVEVKPEEDIAKIDQKIWEMNHVKGLRCLIVTSLADPSLHPPGTTFVSRVVSPNCAVPEDPVTGSAHCTMAHYYGQRILDRGREGEVEASTQTARMVARQLSPRGGSMEVIWRKGSGRVELHARAVTVSEGRMLIELPTQQPPSLEHDLATRDHDRTAPSDSSPFDADTSVVIAGDDLPPPPFHDDSVPTARLVPLNMVNMLEDHPFGEPHHHPHDGDCSGHNHLPRFPFYRLRDMGNRNMFPINPRCSGGAGFGGHSHHHGGGGHHHGGHGHGHSHSHGSRNPLIRLHDFPAEDPDKDFFPRRPPGFGLAGLLATGLEWIGLKPRAVPFRNPGGGAAAFPPGGLFLHPSLANEPGFNPQQVRFVFPHHLGKHPAPPPSGIFAVCAGIPVVGPLVFGNGRVRLSSVLAMLMMAAGVMLWLMVWQHRIGNDFDRYAASPKSDSDNHMFAVNATKNSTVLAVDATKNSTLFDLEPPSDTSPAAFANLSTSPFTPPASVAKTLDPALLNLFIPRTIHLTVPDKTQADSAVHHKISQWRSLNPGFEVILHDDADMAKFVRDEVDREFPGAAAVYTGFRRNVERADFWRYLIVYLKGGVYIDSDVEPLRPLEEWTAGFLRPPPNATATAGANASVPIRPYAVYAPPRGIAAEKSRRTYHLQPPAAAKRPRSPLLPPLLQGFVGAEANLPSEAERVRQSFAFRVQYCQWTFAFRPRHPFLRLVIEAVMKWVKDEKEGRVREEGDWGHQILMRTGPGVFTNAVRRWVREQSEGRMGEVAGEKTLETETMVERFEVVGNVGFMPSYAFGYRQWVDPVPPSDDLLLVRHHFKGSWKDGH
ncbi:hypothetical protein HDU96_005439 [Phlyctochytrium bullatum]|nr:hypothetical protein HDU96_005439 [Phlyctochytrium bullatum]